jgi:hypothetical protein
MNGCLPRFHCRRSRYRVVRSVRLRPCQRPRPCSGPRGSERSGCGSSLLVDRLRRAIVKLTSTLPAIGGAGNDDLQAAASGIHRARFYGEAGNDSSNLGNGAGIARAETGNDELMGGRSNLFDRQSEGEAADRPVNRELLPTIARMRPPMRPRLLEPWSMTLSRPTCCCWR